MRAADPPKALATRFCEACGNAIPWVQRHGLAWYENARFCDWSCRYSAPPSVRFWRKVDKSGGDDACWTWTAGVDRRGYGKFRINDDAKDTLAHRFSYELHFGPFDADLCVCHSCDNPPCVNPSHLFLGTRADNNADMVAKGRHANGHLSGERSPTAKLTDAQAREIRVIYETGLTQREIADKFGVSRSTISNVVLWKNWKGARP